MKNHIGYLESTVLKPTPRGGAEQKKKLPTKNPRIHTFFDVFTVCLTRSSINTMAVEVGNLPEMFKPQVSL